MALKLEGHRWIIYHHWSYAGMKMCISLGPTVTVVTIIFILPTKAREFVFTGVGLCVCLSVCDHDN